MPHTKEKIAEAQRSNLCRGLISAIKAGDGKGFFGKIASVADVIEPYKGDDFRDNQAEQIRMAQGFMDMQSALAAGYKIKLSVNFGPSLNATFLTVYYYDNSLELEFSSSNHKTMQEFTSVFGNTNLSHTSLG